LNKNVTNNVPLNAYAQHALSPKKIETQRQITAVIINHVHLF